MSAVSPLPRRIGGISFSKLLSRKGWLGGGLSEFFNRIVELCIVAGLVVALVAAFKAIAEALIKTP